MRVKAKNAWSVSSLIGTNALKDSCSIMKSMRGNMGCCVLPGHQLPVHPYPVCSVEKLRLHHDALTTLQDTSTGARSTPTITQSLGKRCRGLMMDRLQATACHGHRGWQTGF